MSLQELGVYGAQGTVSAADAEYCRDKLNLMLDEWSTRKRMAYVIRNQAFTFTTSAQSYTIGVTANSPTFTITAAFGNTRPVKIERANLVVVASTPDNEIPLEVINVDQYADISMPALSAGQPSRLYYQPTFPNGTLWPWPYPTTTTNQLRLWMWQQIVEVALADVTTEISLPPGYKNALMLSLAEALSGGAFGKTLTPELEAKASRARANIQSLNTAPPLLATDELGSRVRGHSQVGFNTRYQ